MSDIQDRIQRIVDMKREMANLEAFSADISTISGSPDELMEKARLAIAPTDASKLDDFFGKLSALGGWQKTMTGQPPKYLYVNPEILHKLSRMDGFFQRPELSTQVTVHSPVISRMKFSFGVVEIVEDYEESFLHFE